LVTPYRERREKGLYDPKGKGTQSTTTENLAGLGASQQTKQQQRAAKKK
jgi:hypothetical protein